MSADQPTGRVAVITGASSGIQALADELGDDAIAIERRMVETNLLGASRRRACLRSVTRSIAESRCVDTARRAE
jgi:NADP-dependent 3-hydroxy acid dehydrogenase YdfG